MKGGPTQTTFPVSDTNMIGNNISNSILLVLLSLFFIRFWNDVQLEGGRKKHSIPDLNAGFEELKKGQTVMFSLDSFLRGKKKWGPM